MIRIMCGAATLVLALWCSACASLVRPVPPPSVYVRQISPRVHQAVFFEGPVPVECEVWISNVASKAVELHAVEIHSAGDGAFQFNTVTVRLTEKIPAGATVRFNVSVWGWSNGGDFADGRPVPLDGTAWFTVGHEKPKAVNFRTEL